MNIASFLSRERSAALGLLLLLLVVALALSAPLLYPGDPLRIVGDALLWPGSDPQFPLGTDALGRNIAAMVAFLGTELIWVVLAIGLVSWETIARLTRVEFLRWRQRDFILACRAMGMSNVRLIFGEILPNAIPPVVSVFTLSVATAILVESGLSFLGLGDPSVPTWGRLVGEGRTLIRTDWYICALPGLAIVATVFALSLISDGINNLLNPARRAR